MIGVHTLLYLLCGLTLTQALPLTPEESTVSFRPPGRYNAWQYHVLHNVLLRENGLLFYVPDHLADTPPDDAHTAPTGEQLKTSSNYWDKEFNRFKVEVVSKHNRSQFPDTCAHWVEQPTIMYYGIKEDHQNVFHFFMDSFARLWHTITDQLGYFDLEAFLARKERPTSEQANLVILQRRPQSWTNKYGLHALYNYLTPDQWTFPHGAGFCYKTLTIGTDSYLSVYVSPPTEELRMQKVAATARFVQFVSTAQNRIDAARGLDIPALAQAYAPTPGRMNIGLVHRSKGSWSSRATLNEEELIEAMQKRYSFADVRLLNFNGSLSESIAAAKRTHVLIGMHGAGMTNTLWMQPGGAVVQMIPYGWRTSDGQRYIGADIFGHLATSMNCTHFVWYNEIASNSWLNKGFGGTEKASAETVNTHQQFLDHDRAVHGAWHYQDTWVDLTSFLAVMDQAVQSVHVPNLPTAHI